MTKKTTRKTYKPRTRRSKRKQAAVNTRSIVIIFGFVCLIGLLLYGLNSLKNEVALKNNGSHNKVLDSKIEEVDKSLYEIFFALGISNKDILKDSTASESKGGIVWNTKKQTIKLNQPYSKDELRDTFNKLVPAGVTEFEIQSKGGKYISKIDIEGYTTHLFDFRYPKPQKTTAKKALKTEKRDKAEDSAVFSNKKPKISIIVDDVGIEKNAVDQLIGISSNLTFAILPNRVHTAYAAEKANKNNVEILLHQPMEPKLDSGYSADDAGEGVLLVGQTKEDIVNTINSNLSSIPNVVGVNNHMGSKFTENEELMILIMKNLKQKNLFFVDSLTSPDSKGYNIAKEIGVKTVKRDIFLDDKKKGKSYVKQQLRKLVAKAQKNGYAVGICHTYPQTIEVLREEIPNISKEVNIIPINKLYN